VSEEAKAVLHRSGALLARIAQKASKVWKQTRWPPKTLSPQEGRILMLRVWAMDAIVFDS
jgi:hypothetical protein